ncbi:hypothetical protein DID88_009454 [Monilinia fructigena]|uniref:Major facilitator superfamily (MFS) profile domain-containing protein n=1 Tax=Monilinia fructigena TaxID=38457 RepID=A0A395IP20_9HELO|nr:hypothetical protein DID88_009454 [Monilinia fructigena]
MSQKYSELNTIWTVMDVRDMKLGDGETDVAIDKGTLDAMIHGSMWEPPQEVRDNVGRYVNEVARVLKSGGQWLYITYRQPHFMKPFLLRECIWETEMEANNETTEEAHISNEIITEKTITEVQTVNTDHEGWSSSHSVHDVKSPSDLIQHQTGEQKAIEKTDSPERNDILEQQDDPYTSFSTWEKRFLVLIATFACFFSPFTTQIYFPAVNTIAKRPTSYQKPSKFDSHNIHAPAFIGGFSDIAGHRPAYIICFTIYILSNIALALQNNYVALLILRMVQSAGGSGTVALANAVVADIATSAERGIYIGYSSMMASFAPAVGPILGGVISQYNRLGMDFRILAVFSTVFFIPLLFFMPETCRKIVGDGSIPLSNWNRCLVNIYNERKNHEQGISPDYTKRDELAAARNIRFPNPLSNLRIISEKEAALLLFYA